MITIENMVPPAMEQAAPAGPVRTPLSGATAPGMFGSGPGAQSEVSIAVPDRIPPRCVEGSARAYSLSPLVLLAILKVESNGRTGVIGKNANGSQDIGPSQFNTNSWAKILIEKYKIPREALLNDMCQSVRALAFAVRTEVDQAGGDLWEGIGNYHSRTPVHHVRYIQLVHGAYKQMTGKGKF